MQLKRKWLPALAAGIVLALAVVWFFGTWQPVDGKLYPRRGPVLDLRGRTVTTAQYEKLKEAMPGREIRWDVPFQGGTLADDARQVTVTALSMEDAEILARYLPRLQQVEAEACPDTGALCWLQQERPQLQVRYRVPLNGTYYDSSVTALILSHITGEDLAGIGCLPRLKSVTVTGGEGEALAALRSLCREKGMQFHIRLGGEALSENAVSVTAEGITDGELGLLTLLPRLKKLHLVEPEAGAEKLLALEQSLPGVTVTWEKSVLGLTFPRDAKVIDLTEGISLGPDQQPGDKTGYQYGLDFPVQGTQEEVPTAIKMSAYHPVADRTDETDDLIAQVESAMAYFPEAEQVLMIGGLLHNVKMAGFREAHREEYKVVWSVACGKVLTRSDATFFMPVKYHVYYLSDAEAYNLRYLEEAVAVDIGHMNVSDISFVEYMPDLEYLILAHTSIQYIEPIRSCKKLKFLEVDWTGIRDLTPLQDCTALEDLNIGNTGVSVEPLKQMPWLKNVWMIFKKSAYVLTQALPDTRVVSSGNATVASGWRDLPNYYAMRDQLKMYYMSW